MQLSKHNAMKIVSDIHKIIDHHINIMNHEGIIIASTDEQRIGDFHEGAKKIVEEALDQLVISESGEYEGAVPGVNLPIRVRDKIIGVIGITGPYHEVVKYGQIVKRMTEILLMDVSAQEQKARSEKILCRYLMEWLQGENKNINKAFVERGLGMNIDITIPRRVMVIGLYTSVGYLDSLEGVQDMEAVEKRLKSAVLRLNPDNIYLKTATNIVCAVVNRPDKEMRRIAGVLLEAAQKHDSGKVRVAIGIDGGSTPYTMAYKSYIKGKKAMEACLRNEGSNIRFYDDINMEIFTDEIADMTKEEYIRKIFKGYSFRELDECIGILKVFYDEEGSITSASEQLHMHKNTLQYKLKKMQERTGYDPRALQASSLFYIAIYFFEEIRGLMAEEFFP